MLESAPKNLHPERSARRNKQRVADAQSPTRMGQWDHVLFGLVLLLLGFGMLSLYSASANHAQLDSGNSLAFVFRQGVAAIIGLVMLFITSQFKLSFWQRMALPFSLTVVGLLVLTLVMGTIANGSERWLVLPVIGRFQPSELAKLAMVIVLASSIHPEKRLTGRLMFGLGVSMVMMALIFKQPNLSITILLGSVMAIMLFVARWPMWLYVLAAPALGVGLYQKIMATEYQRRRIVGWLDPWGDAQDTGYNLVQSYYAVGSGGWFGVGYGQSIQKLFYLPFPYTDFIFSVICEEWGFLGAILLVCAFGALAWRGYRISMRCPVFFGKMLAFGITTMLTLQVIINICVTIGLFPVTGVTLPLISYGGTSLVVTLVMLGVLLGISKVHRTPSTLHDGVLSTVSAIPV